MNDNGSGSLSGPSGEAGTIDYNTGVGSITLQSPLANGTAIMAQYQKTPNDPFAVNVPLLTVENTLGLLTSVKNDLSKDRSIFDKNSIFYKIIMNGIYSLVLSLILKKLIPKITKLITKALAKRKANQLARKFKRYQARAKLLQEQAQEIEKKAEAALALKALKSVYDYVA
jgi:hypothetical protein